MSEKKPKIYETILEIIQDVIEKHKTMDNVSDENKHYFIQGLEVAKSVIEQEQEFVYGDYAYEKLEEVVKSFLSEGSIDEDEVVEILESNASEK